MDNTSQLFQANNPNPKSPTMRSKSLGRTRETKPPKHTRRDSDPTIFSIRENIKNVPNKEQPGHSSLYSMDQNRKTPTGVNTSFSVTTGIIEPQPAGNTSMNVGHTEYENFDNFGDDEPAFPMIKNKPASTQSVPQSRKVIQKNDLQMERVRSEAANGNIEGLINDPKSIEIISRNHQNMLKGYKPRGNWTPLARTRPNKDTSIRDSFQLKEKNNSMQQEEEYRVFPTTEKASKAPPNMVLQQLAMYLTQNKGNMEVGFNSGLKLLEDHLQVKRSNKTIRSNSLVRNSNNNLVQSRDNNNSDVVKRNILQNKLPFANKKNQHVKAKYADYPNKPIAQPATPRTTTPTTGAYRVSDIYNNAKLTDRRPSRSQQPNIESNRPTERKIEKTSNLLRIGHNKQPKVLRLEDPDKDLVYEGGPRVRTPRLRNDNPLMNSNTLIRGLYRVKNGSARSLDTRSEGDLSKDQDANTKSMTLAQENPSAQERINSRRASSTAQSNRPSRPYFLNINTPTQARSRDRQNMSVTHTSSFSNKAQRMTMEGFNKGWKQSKKMVEDGRRKEASFITFEVSSGSPVLPRAKGTPFGFAGRKPIFSGGVKTPGPGRYYIQRPNKVPAYSFGQDKRPDVTAMPLVGEINKMLESVRFMK